MAKQLLADDIKSISDISAEVGFDNFSYFSTVFKKYTGITPGEYRRSKNLKIKKYHLFLKKCIMDLLYNKAQKGKIKEVT